MQGAVHGGVVRGVKKKTAKHLRRGVFGQVLPSDSTLSKYFLLLDNDYPSINNFETLGIKSDYTFRLFQIVIHPKIETLKIIFFYQIICNYNIIFFTN